MPGPDERRAAEFMQLWTRDARNLYAYIMTLVFDLNLADDILQETVATAWERFDDYAVGSNFGAWASRIAYYKSLSTLKQRKPHLVSMLKLEELEWASAGTFGRNSDADRQFEQLHSCLQQLREADRDLLQRRYRHDESISQIARGLRRTPSAIYKSLERIHEWLFDCVTRKLRAESLP